MKRYLFVGDPHAEPSSLDEMDKLINFIYKTAKDNSVNSIVFLGDQYHTHSIVHLSVIDFWLKAFEKLESAGTFPDNQMEIYCLVGNHDKPGYDVGNMNAMKIHKGSDVPLAKGITYVVNEFMYENGMLFVSYQFNHEKFLEICNTEDAKTCKMLVCHQTFYGSKYENGFYAPAKDSINPDLVPQKSILSGHIHSPQKFGKVEYIGAPRWRTITDANVDRKLLMLDIEDGKVLKREEISLNFVCTPIYHFTESPDNELKELDPRYLNGKVFIDLYGDFEFINKKKKEYTELGIKVRTFPTQTKSFKIKESEGISKSLVKFVSNYKPKNNTSMARLLELANERLLKSMQNG